MAWGSNLFPLLIVTASGGFTGFFVYSPAPGQGNLIASIAATAGTDPYGNSYPAGIASYNGHGAIVNLLSTINAAFFQYQDLGSSTQGGMVLSVASVAGNDPVNGAAYVAGLKGYIPAAATSITVLGPTIIFHAFPFTRDGQVASLQSNTPPAQPQLRLDAPEQTTASHMQMLMAGASPDGSKVAQLVIGAVSGSAVLTPLGQDLLEVQGIMALVEPTGTSQAINVVAAGDTFSRFKLRADGLQQWGTGSAGIDTNLYRASAAQLAADNIAKNVSGSAETWHNASLATGFAAAGGSFATPGYQFEPIGAGRVRLRGPVSLTANQAAFATVFTLPAAYSPAFEQEFYTPNTLSGAVAGSAVIEVLSSGIVRIGVAGITGNAFALDGIVIELD